MFFLLFWRGVGVLQPIKRGIVVLKLLLAIGDVSNKNPKTYIFISSLHAGQFFMISLLSAVFSRSTFWEKSLSGIPSESQTAVCIRSGPTTDLGSKCLLKFFCRRHWSAKNVKNKKSSDLKKIEPWPSNNVVCATSKVSDQPAHMRRLIRAFASCLNILWLLGYWPNIFWSF